MAAASSSERSWPPGALLGQPLPESPAAARGGDAFEALIEQLRAEHTRALAELHDRFSVPPGLVPEYASSEVPLPSALVEEPPEPPLCDFDRQSSEGDGSPEGPRSAARAAWTSPPQHGGESPGRKSIPPSEGMDAKESARLKRSQTLKSVEISSYLTKKAGLLPEPEPNGLRERLKKFAQGPLEVISGAAILLNVIFVFVQLEVVGHGASESTKRTLMYISNCFTLFFLFELVLKMFMLRGELWVVHGRIQKFNVLDAFVVLLGVLDSWVLSPMAASTNVAVLRCLRSIRALRVLRVVRTIEVFRDLRILVSAVVASFLALFWSMILLTIVMLVAALFLCQATASVLDEPGFDQKTKDFVTRFYGTASRASWSVFELTFSGGWPNYARPLVEDVSFGFAFFFFFYIIAVIFAMFRIITALFLKETLNTAAQDVDMMINEKIKEKNAYSQKLLGFFSAADTSGDGFLSWEEFDLVLSDDRVRAYLATLDIDAAQSRSLFEMLDDGDGAVSVHEFVKGAMRLKGQARSQDVVAIMHDCNRLTRKFDALDSFLRMSLGSSRAGSRLAVPAR